MHSQSSPLFVFEGRERSRNGPGKPFLEYLLARAQMHVASPVTSSRHPISDYNHVNEQDGISEESDSIDTNNGNMPSFMANFPTAQKREIRRCGKHLIKHLLSVCNNCLRSPHTDFIGMSEKRAISSSMGFLSAAKRDTSGAVTKVTKMCCLQACSDDEVKQFCCVP
uniref:Insulin-like domain-containing protein n=1 Tax=Ditylenchus dipsaci TaxID=166011 RepID=A0A915D637_9BILA